MTHMVRILISMAVVLGGTASAMAIEETTYEVIQKSDQFEIRDYSPHIVAEVVVTGTLEKAGSKAFRKLFGYISGDNRSRTKIAMTAPVSQQAAGEKIKMTAPVSQERMGDKWLVSFMMPAEFALETLPIPDNREIVLRQVPQRRMAAVRYSGFWSEKAYLKNKLVLEKWIRDSGLTITGNPIWARYNPPFTPWFMRRNEILIPISGETNPG
jgi:hypothetical protein